MYIYLLNVFFDFCVLYSTTIDERSASIVQTIKINGLVIKEKVRYFEDEVRFDCKLKQLAMLDYSHRTPVYVPARATCVHCTFIYRAIHKYRVSRCNETVRPFRGETRSRRSDNPRHDSVDLLFRLG